MNPDPERSYSMTSSERQKFEYETEGELADDFKKLVLSSPSNVNIATDHLYESILEEAVMGIAFHMHFQSKHPVSLDESLIQEFSDNFSMLT